MEFRNKKGTNVLIAAIKLTRIPITVTCFGVALLGSVSAGGITPTIGIAFIAIVLLIIHGNSVNDIADYEIDKINLKNASDRPLVSGDISMKGIWGLNVATGLLAIGLSILLGYIAVASTLILIGYNYLYSLRPIRITDKTILSPLTLSATYSFVPFVFGYFASVQSTSFPWTLALALYFGFLARLLLKDFRDVRGDAKFGKRTFLLEYGPRITCVASGLAAVFSLVLILMSIGFSVGASVVLIMGNLIVVRQLVRLARAKQLALQARLITTTAKVGNCSILVVFIFYICKNFAVHEPYLQIISFVVGVVLLAAALRTKRHEI